MSSGRDEAAVSVESTWLLENVESEHTDGSVLPGQTWFAESWNEDAREARVLDRCSALVREDLGVAPSPRITGLIDDWLDRRVYNRLSGVFASAPSR